MTLEPTDINLPATIDESTITQDDIMHLSATFATLTPHHRAIMSAIVDNFMSERIQSDRDMAKEIGCSRNTVRYARRNLAFNRVMVDIMPALVRAKGSKYLSRIDKAGNVDWRANKFLLEFAGLSVDKSLTGVIHTSVDMATANSPGAAMEQVVTQFANLGYDRQRLLDDMGAVFDRLRDEGAI